MNRDKFNYIKIVFLQRAVRRYGGNIDVEMTTGTLQKPSIFMGTKCFIVHVSFCRHVR